MTMRFFWSLLFCFSATFSFAQRGDDLRIAGEIMVYLIPDVEPSVVLKEVITPSLRRPSESITSIESLGIRHNIQLIKCSDCTEQQEQELLAALQRHSKVLAAQFNYHIKFRNTPNDLRFGQQWDMELMEAPAAWEYSTGGYTQAGTPIVVAIMDSGFETGHEDLSANLWHNTAEILGDGIDNDNNGFIDDDMGWDFHSDSPAISYGPHGTGCAGIIGAVGNNSIGVTGINWDIQMMLFSFSSVSDLIVAYEYAIDQRGKFNDSNGEEGAFVVTTNNSFGQARIRCDQQPLWAAMYDLMGEVGILSSAGVANERYDVDVSGDMPATCPSDYLLISCNTNEDDNLEESSAYGSVSVDIGSPGEDTFTTRSPNTYGFFSQNSAATPHVTGAIALLYSGGCSSLEADAINQPAATALLIKQMIMEGVDQLPSLANRTLTGGRLNLAKAMNRLDESCNNNLGELQLSNVYPNPTLGDLKVEFLTPTNGEYAVEIYNVLGQLVLRKTVNVGLVGIRSFTLEMERYSPGVYVLRFGQREEWVSRKVMVY